MKSTALLLTHNNSDTIRDTLKSLTGFNLRVGDIGSSDGTLEACRHAAITNFKFNNDYSHIRNSLVSDGWNLHIQPWEILIDEDSRLLQIANSTVPKAFYFQVIEGKVITKEVRYWHSKMGLRFENPIYESIDCPSAEFLEDVIIYSAKKKTDSAMPLIKHWKETKPAAIQPYYYEACALLLEQKFEDFTRVARYYLMHNTDNTMSAIMLKYYLAMVDLYVLEEYKDIIPNLMHCIASNPLMAEFWCLLGDLSYKAQDYGKAIAFYENAIILGSRRLKKDWWPLEIDKYKKHPERMIANCQKIMNETKILVRK